MKPPDHTRANRGAGRQGRRRDGLDSTPLHDIAASLELFEATPTRLKEQVSADTNLPDRVTGTIGAQIEAHHQAARQAFGTAIEHARRAGELLAHQKALLAHGDWLPWLAAHCPSITDRTARRYMQIATRWAELAAKSDTVSDLPVRQALKLLSAPGTSDADQAPAPQDRLAAALFEELGRLLGDECDQDDAEREALDRLVRRGRTAEEWGDLITRRWRLAERSRARIHRVSDIGRLLSPLVQDQYRDWGWTDADAEDLVSALAQAQVQAAVVAEDERPV